MKHQTHNNKFKNYDNDATTNEYNNNSNSIHPAAVRCDTVLHQAFRARRVRKSGIGSEVRHGVTSGVSRETSKA